jgi:hypothetical protein
MLTGHRGRGSSCTVTALLPEHVVIGSYQSYAWLKGLACVPSMQFVLGLNDPRLASAGWHRQA